MSSAFSVEVDTDCSNEKIYELNELQDYFYILFDGTSNVMKDNLNADAFFKKPHIERLKQVRKELKTIFDNADTSKDG